MNSTWYNVAVVLLWLATMGWLISQKMMPALLVGDPPGYRTVVEAQQEDPLVGWRLAWNGHQVGWALSRTSLLAHEMTEVRSLVHFDDLPLREMIPEWLRSLLLPGDEGLPIRLQMEVKSKLTFDPLQRLSQFESSVRFPPLEDGLKVQGTLDGDQLTLSTHSAYFTDEKKISLPQGALLGDAFSPQTQLPALREGQTWSVRVYSPVRPPKSPEEILHAKVEGTETVFWHGQMVDAWVVVYRTDPGEGTVHARSPRGTLWVRKDGTVLKQGINLFDSTMTFVRMPGDEAAALDRAVGDRR